MISPEHSALIMVDMQNGFIDEASPLCVAGAKASLPACERALHAARALHMPVFHVRRRYAADGSNVEAVRYRTWIKGKRPLSEAWPESLCCPPELAPLPGEPIVEKPSFSAFFGTELDLMLRQRGISTVVLAGTATPNCIRSTAFDALARNLNVIMLSDATSSATMEIQHANLRDMENIGVFVMSSSEFASGHLNNLPDAAAEAPRSNPIVDIPADSIPILESIKPVSSGWINKYMLHYELPDGRPHSYEAVSRKGAADFEAQLRQLGKHEPPREDAVAMVPILPDGSVLLIREFRYPLNSWCVSFPAGLVDEGETLLEAARRELSEETGYRPRADLGDFAVQPLAQAGFSSTGMTEENVQAVIVFAEPAEVSHPNDSELICPFVLRRDQIRAFLDENKLPLGARCQLLLEKLAL